MQIGLHIIGYIYTGFENPLHHVKDVKLVRTVAAM